MAKDEKTILDAEETFLDSDETVLDTEAADATLPDDDGATILDDATLLDGEAVPYDESGAPAIEKGAFLLDTYRVESDAIEGGMGAVWRVHHTGWKVDLAMKRPQASLFQSEKQKDIFIQECDAWIKLGLHPHIVSCYYVRRIGDTPTIFSEWMDGGSLKDAIRDGRLYEGDAAERILDIAIQFARGLHYAHEQELIHRDVKPANLMLLTSGLCKVSDFGIAFSLHGRENGQDTENYSTGYTLAYASPEQVAGELPTKRTDIYSWAVSVLEMYLGSCLWQSGVVAGTVCEEYFPAVKVPIPQKMRELLRECLREQEADRPHDFAAVDKVLRAVYKQETGRAYERKKPKSALDTASSLNNRALSFLDLGKREEAVTLLTRAAKADRNCEEAVYNRNLLLWRDGAQDDLDTIAATATLYENNGTAQNACRVAELCLFSQDRKLAESWLDIAEKKPDFDPIAVHRLRQKARTLPAAFGYAKDESGLWKTECVSPSGKLALEVNHSSVRVWDTLEKKVLWDLPVRFGWKCSTFSFDDCYLYLGEGSNIGTVFRCDLQSGSVEALLESPYVAHIKLHPDGKRMLTAGESEPIRLWDAQTGKKIKTYRSTAQPAKSISCVCPLPGWKRFLAGGSHLCLIDLETEKEIYARKPFKKGDYGIRAVYTDAGGYTAVTDEYHTIRYWDIQTGCCLKTCEPQILPATSVPREQIVPTAGGRFWYIPRFKDVPGFQLCRVVSVQARLRVDAQTELAKQEVQRLLQQGDMAKARHVIAEVFALPEFAATQAWSDMNVQAGMGCAITGLYGVRPVKTYAQRHNEPVCAGVSCSPDGSRAALGVRYIEHAAEGYDFDTNALLIFPSSDSLGEPQALYSEATGWPRDHVAFLYPRFSPDGRRLLLDNRGKRTLQLFGAMSREQDNPPYSGSVWGWFADGETLLCGAMDPARVSLSTGERTVVYADRPGIKPVGATVSAGGAHVFCIYEDGGIRIFRADDGTLLREASLPVEVCRKGISAAVPSRDERYVICGGDDGLIRVYGMESAQIESAMEGHHAAIVSLAQSEAGNDLYSASADGTMIRWQIDWEYAP